MKINQSTKFEKFAIYASWLVSIFGILSSLYFSEVKRLVPCELCWYQRIFMYPLAIIIAVSLIRKNIKEVPYIVLPFSIIGSGIAFYHVLLEQQFIPDEGACSGEVACSFIPLELFGFLTIPMMSLGGFLTITALMMAIIIKRKNRK